MAQFLTPLNACLSKMQAGEKRFARRLEQLLEDDYQCWFDLPVGKRQRYADFIVVHPLRGVLLLEVKDWKLESIHSIDRQSASLLTSSGLKQVSNPLEQARQCAYQLVRQLERDPQLLSQTGKYRGKLAFPYGYGVVLTSITRKQFEASALDEVLPWNRVLCKDEMLESTDPEDFQQILWNMFEYQFATPLTLPMLDRIRWHLFPEIRIGDAQRSLFATDDIAGAEPELLLPDIMKVMDMQQEQLARSLGTGHRVIHGVAGSGKTLILGFRCLYLARVLHKPILVLCYNITLAARLRVLMQEQGIADRVNVYHFHDWCGDMLRHYHVARPAFGDAYLEKLVPTVIKAVENGQIPRGQYGAVMIDEGHDFRPEWLKLISGMVDPETDSLLLLYDDAQSIYNHEKTLNFSLSSVGINARGRTTVLKLNYRNTDEIFRYAHRFASHYLQPQDCDEDHIPLLTPQSAGRHGQEPELRRFESFNQEVETIARWLQHWNENRGMAWSSMGVLYRHNYQGEKLYAALKNAAVPCQWMASSKTKKQFNPQHDSVKLMTMHSSKGLEFPLVVIAGLGFTAPQDSDEQAEAKLLYVAMTRATEKLLLTSHEETDFTRVLGGRVLAEAAVC